MRNASASIHLHARSAFRCNDYRVMGIDNFARIVIASAVNDYYLNAPTHIRQRIERRADRARLVKRWDDDGDRFH